MSERLPYEEQLPQQLRDFPLPDEDAAWADMRRRLEEDDDDGVIAWWRRGCLGWGLLLLGLLAAGWWFYNKENKRGEVVKEKKEMTGSGKKIRSTNPDGSVDTQEVYKLKEDGKTIVSNKKDTVTSDKDDLTMQQPVPVEHQTPAGKKEISVSQSSSYKKKKIRKRDEIPSSVNKSNGQLNEQPVDKIKSKVETTGKAGSKDSARSQNTPVAVQMDSVAAVKKDSINKTVKIDSTITAAKKKDSTKKKDFFFSAGLAINQQLPIAGQKSVPYGSQGRKSSLADYIPSVYFRYHKRGKWFVQAEFRYGAPQYNKPVVFYRQFDSTGGISTRTSRSLQRTYYHQLPLSFNYHATKDWTIGAGVVWNRFSKAYYEETIRTDTGLDSSISKLNITGKQPDELSSSYFQGLIETQYQWRKFSFGARYNFGLQPYLQFTLPGEDEKKERNQSLQIFLRYELFRSSSGK